MQNDLISRSALIEIIGHDIEMTERFIKALNELDFEEHAKLQSQLNTLKSYKGIVTDMPTAYDVESVVQELDDVLYDCCSGTEYHMAYGKMVEVVRNGGKE